MSSTEEISLESLEYAQKVMDKLYDNNIYVRDLNVYFVAPEVMEAILVNCFLAGSLKTVNDEAYNKFADMLKKGY